MLSSFCNVIFNRFKNGFFISEDNKKGAIARLVELLKREVGALPPVPGDTLAEEDTVKSNNYFSLVDAHLIATTLPGPGQRYKLCMCF